MTTPQAALVDAARAVCDRWDSPAWKWGDGPTADLIATLRAALAQAEAAQPVAAFAQQNVADLASRLLNAAQGVDLGADGMGWSPDPKLLREAADRLLEVAALADSEGTRAVQYLRRARGNEQAINRFHHIMQRHGLHPGRTDDDLLEILDAHLTAAAPQPAEAAPTGPLDDFGRSIVYDTEAVDNVTHALTGDEGEDDSVTVLERFASYVQNVWPGKPALQVLLEYEEKLIAEAAQPQQPAPEPVAGVPHQPTMEMLYAGTHALHKASGGDFDASIDEVLFVWNAMLAAAPQPPEAAA